MLIDFPKIPHRVRKHVRDVFARANEAVSAEMIQQPFTTEPALDTELIRQVSARPPIFFPAEQVLVRIETHSLASRRLYDGVEIADIAILVTLSQYGVALKQKVGLLQTKRLVARHVRSGTPSPRAFGSMKFRYDSNCNYEALISGSDQSAAIAVYATAKLPVFYGLYNPKVVPYEGQVPAIFDVPLPAENKIGFRVLPAGRVSHVP